MADDDDPYREPVLYDLEYEGQREDIVHYVTLARRSRGPVLELGCGNGRITIPMARSGAFVHGIDRSEPMLADLARKLRREPDAVRLRVRTAVGDFRAFEVSTKFAAILLPFNAIHHCEGPDDVRRVLAGVRAALRPEGTFGLDCYLPDPILYSRERGRRYEERTFTDPRSGAALVSWEEGWWDAATHVHHVVYVYERPDRSRDEVHLRLRMFERPELLALFQREGFVVRWQSCDFQGSSMRDDALKWVLELALA
jgi:SAM-dependent methyltransferase